MRENSRNKHGIVQPRLDPMKLKANRPRLDLVGPLVYVALAKTSTIQNKAITFDPIQICQSNGLDHLLHATVHVLSSLCTSPKGSKESQEGHVNDMII